MTNRRIYVLDANILIQAKNEYYPFEIVPGFWDTLAIQAQQGRIHLIDRVWDDLQAEKDQLSVWVDTELHVAKQSTNDGSVFEAYKEVMTWVAGQDQFRDFAKRQFAEVADGWLVAYAIATSSIVVTHESFEPKIKRRVKIPNVCHAFDVKYVNTFDMLRTFGTRWGILDEVNPGQFGS